VLAIFLELLRYEPADDTSAILLLQLKRQLKRNLIESLHVHSSQGRNGTANDVSSTVKKLSLATKTLEASMQKNSSIKINHQLLILPALLLNVCAASEIQAADVTHGKATVYSDHFKGKKTASGETYKPGGLTAASNKLPIGSKVVVKNRKTGKKVTVKINDHMAKNAKAHIDLSKGAANKLGVKGTAPVDAKVIAK
jgi:rare lipoprotein A